MKPQFPIFLPEDRDMAARSVVSWAMSHGAQSPGRALRLLYYPGRGLLQGARPDDYSQVFEACRLALLTERFVAKGLSREASELLSGNMTRAEKRGVVDDAVAQIWSAERVRQALGVRAEGEESTALTPAQAVRDVKDAATRIRAILVSRTLLAMLEVGEIVGSVRANSKASYRVLAEETGLGISHTALRNAEKVFEQYELLPPWVREELPYSHHVMLLPVRDLARKRTLAVHAFDLAVPVSLRAFQGLIGGATKPELATVSPPRVAGILDSLQALLGSSDQFDSLLAAVPGMPKEELQRSVELIGSTLDRLSQAEELLTGELARRSVEVD
ncbi:MAG: hypothetical protein ACJAYU_003592 [Bradymonadia bacterium]|jgi:hypothetical protein